MAFDLSEEQLRATEVAIGAVFPEAYRSRMMRLNGGEVVTQSDYWNAIPLRDTTDSKRLSRTANNILTETKSFAEWRGWPKDAIAIAEDGTGDALVLLRLGNRIGPPVFHWCHEDGTLTLVAEDFSELADGR